MSTAPQLPAPSTTSDTRARAAEAAAAAPGWAATADADRARALRAVADALDGASDELVVAADAETALGQARLTGEVARTSGQLRMFAELIERGSHLDPVITEGDPATGRPDVRRMQVAIGPAAVFAASNFPFAFSVAGGDTASALAAGCPVVVKAHEGHPLTSRLTADLVSGALRDAGCPDGVFSIVFGQSAGAELVVSPEIRAVGFTGSLAGATALTALIQTREDPIPFFGELGSVNPVVVLPDAATQAASAIADGYAQSLTLGSGQFCTNPGLMFVPDSPALLESIAEAIATTTGATMLTPRIRDQYETRVSEPAWSELVQLGRGTAGGSEAPEPQVRTVALEEFAQRLGALTQERFGPAGLIVTYSDIEALLAVLGQLPGSLTGSVHARDAELDLAARVAQALRPRVGRLIFNGWPTGVAVCWAMMHGGPWPASSAPWSTSVGGRAIDRWLVAVAYQDWPDELLPAPLRRANPRGLDRVVQPAPR